MRPIPVSDPANEIERTIERFRDSTRVAERELEIAAGACNVTTERNLAEVRANISHHYNGGWPTKLEHQLIHIFGFDNDQNEGLLAFNRNLLRHQDEILLVVEQKNDPSLIGETNCERRMIAPELGYSTLRFNFFAGRINGGLSFKETTEDELILGDAEKFFPADRMAWIDDVLRGEPKLRSLEECITFPTAHFIHALRKSKKPRWLEGDHKVEILIGDVAIATYQQKQSLPTPWAMQLAVVLTLLKPGHGEAEEE